MTSVGVNVVKTKTGLSSDFWDEGRTQFALQVPRSRGGA